MSQRHRRALADESGFSLIELLVAMSLGSIVLTALLTVFVNGLTATTNVTDRVQALQDARLTLDRMNTLLQAEVCAAGAAPVTDAQADSITFTANVGDVAANPTRYRLRYDSTNNTIVEERFAPIVASDGSISFPSASTSTQTIGTNIVPAGGTMFTYYTFDLVNGGLDPDPLAQPISDSDEQRVVAVKTAITAQPERSKKTSDPRATTIESQAVVGSADSADPNKGPKC
jgi:prepilin-type N-terminal cleavage/methylation domain-containing protein